MSKLINLEKFRRVKKKEYYPEIDGLRFVAIMPVVLAHYIVSIARNGKYALSEEAIHKELFFRVVDSGVFGVLLFFGISGFIVALPFFKAIHKGGKVNLKTYFARRVSRIEPPYIIAMTLLFVAQLLMSMPDVGIKNYLVSLLYLHGIIYGEYSPVNPVAWSLEIEVQFYLLLPLLFLVLRKIKQNLLVLTLLAGVLLWISVGYKLHHYNLQLSFLRMGHYFIAGVLVAYLHIFKAHVFRIPNGVATLLFIASMLGFVFGQLYWDSFLYHLQLVSVFLIIYSAMAGRTVKRVLSKPFVAIVGGMCYTIYLYHYAMLHILTKTLLVVYTTGSWWLDFLIYSLLVVAIVLIISAVLFRLFEKPFMKHNWYKRKSA